MTVQTGHDPNSSSLQSSYPKVRNPEHKYIFKFPQELPANDECGLGTPAYPYISSALCNTGNVINSTFILKIMSEIHSSFLDNCDVPDNVLRAMNYSAVNKSTKILETFIIYQVT